MPSLESFTDATASYEAWRASRIPTVEADLERKHQRLTESPFVLLRGTYYRFLKAFGELLPDLARAPRTIAVGDLHIENFGTWRDADGRLAWGINDFDEIDVLPYTIDLTRLATSASLAIAEGHLKLNAADAATEILHGWRDRIGRGVVAPFVLGERHPNVYRLASEAFSDPTRFERKLRTLPSYEGELPKPARRLVATISPPGIEAAKLHTRVAGVGSLGARRVVALAEVGGGLLAREAKQIPGSASRWALDARPPRGLAALVSASHGVSADPCHIQRGKWVARRLAPDMARLELTNLRRRHDEGAILRSMGAETANVHLVAQELAVSPKAVLKDEAQRSDGWLADAAATMVTLTRSDYREWCG